MSAQSSIINASNLIEVIRKPQFCGFFVSTCKFLYVEMTEPNATALWVNKLGRSISLRLNLGYSIKVASLLSSKLIATMNIISIKSLDLPEELRSHLEDMAKKLNISVEDVMGRLVRDFLEKSKQKDKQYRLELSAHELIALSEAVNYSLIHSPQFQFTFPIGFLSNAARKVNRKVRIIANA